MLGHIRAITTDSASVNIKMIQILEKSLKSFNATDAHIRCMAHVINLGAQKLLDNLKATATDNETMDENSIAPPDISGVLWRVRRIVIKVRALNLIWEAQVSAAKLPSLHLILDMRVRWNSTHDMLNRFIQLRPAIHAICQIESSLLPYRLSNDDWNILIGLRSCLDTFIKATEHLSGSTYPTLSSQLPYFIVLASRLEGQINAMKSKDPANILIPALNAAWVKLDEYHSRTGSAQAIATILDPRYKLTALRNLSWTEPWIETARLSIERIYDTQYAPLPIDKPTTPEGSNEEDIEDDFIQAVFGSSQGSLVSTSGPSQLEVYLDEPVEGRKVYKPLP